MTTSINGFIPLKLQEDINEVVNRMHGEDAWPFPRGLAPSIETSVTQEVERYVRLYAESWTEVPQTIDPQQF